MLATAVREYISTQLSPGRVMSRQAQLNFCWILIRSRGISKPPEELLYLPLHSPVFWSGQGEMSYKEEHVMMESPAQHYYEQSITTL